MEFTCEKRDLQSGVGAVEKIVTTRSALPIIANILFEIGKSGVKLSANNLEMGMELSVKATTQKEGSFLLPAKTLSGIVSKLPETTVTFKVSENRQVKITYDKSQFNLHSLPPDEFPVLPKVKDGKSFSLEAKVLSKMIKQTIFAVSSSEDKYTLTGVMIETGKSPISGESSNIRLVATDGYRLAKSGSKVANLADVAVNAIVPARALQELVKLIDSNKDGQVKVTISNEQISFNFHDVYIVSRLIQGQFPDYKQVIPKKFSTRVLVKTEELHRSAERAAVIASGSANVTSFEVKGGKITISAHTPDVGSIEE